MLSGRDVGDTCGVQSWQHCSLAGMCRKTGLTAAGHGRQVEAAEVRCLTIDRGRHTLLQLTLTHAVGHVMPAGRSQAVCHLPLVVNWVRCRLLLDDRMLIRWTLLTLYRQIYWIGLDSIGRHALSLQTRHVFC